MTVKELITRLLDEPMDAEVKLETSNNLFEITNVTQWASLALIQFKDWRDKKENKEL